MNEIVKVGADAKVAAGAASKSNLAGAIQITNHYKIECRDKHGNFKWVEEFDNLVTNEGLNDLLDKYLKGSTYTAAFYVGLTAASPTPAAGDTMSSHGGWTEFTTYTVAASPQARPTLTLGTVASQSVDNSASTADFTIAVASPDSQTIGGAFLTTNATIGGSTGTLYSVAAFTLGNKGPLNGGDTLAVTVTATAASA